MQKLNFSVSMCVYKGDRPEWFKVAVDSVLNQTVPPDEIVLVVDGPVTEELNFVIKEYEQNPIFKIIRLKENVGLGNALKIAVESSSYEIIARMDSDDISLPRRFEEQLEFFDKNPSLDIVGGDITEFLDDEENIIAFRRVPTSNSEIKQYMKTRCAFNHMTVMYKRSAVLNAGNYLDWFYNEDYYLWLRMMQNNCEFANTGTVLTNVRVGAAMYKRRGGIRYFKSEAKLQKYMLKNKIIGFGTYFSNVTKRFVVQVLLPNKIRELVFKRFAREK